MKLLTLVASGDEVLSSFSPLLVVWIQLAGDGIPPDPTVLSQFQRAFLSVREQCHLEIIKVQVRASYYLRRADPPRGVTSQSAQQGHKPHPQECC
jgi:hypothetical protein